MSVTTFAAIDVGSNNLAMKIYEFSKKNGLHEIDSIKHTLELGSDTYTFGALSYPVINELIQVLEKFVVKMKEYAVSEYAACATSGLREAQNCIFVLDQIQLRTGLHIRILSNSEQRFLCYKAMAFFEKPFNQMIAKNTAVVDVGAGSIQISLFNHNVLQNTQNIKLGSLRIRELLSNVEKETLDYTSLINEYMEYDLSTYEHLFLPKNKVKHMIGFGEHLTELVKLSKKLAFKQPLDIETYTAAFQAISKKGIEQCSKELNLSKEQASLLLPTAVVFHKLLKKSKAADLYLSNTCLCDALAVDFALKQEKLSLPHDFIADIVETSRNIARRYECNEAHLNNVEHIALALFDSMKKVHGMNRRDRLYLQIAVILHSCGQFINMNQIQYNSYHIVMSTEIIGLSHEERKLVANVVRYKSTNFPSFKETNHCFDKTTYVKLAKLTAILRLANSLDKSHKQKLNAISCRLKYTETETQLIIETETFEDITLEQGLFTRNAEFFSQIYGIRPVLKQKRSI
ncbi:MAG: exopolyphosphatase [bacterium]|nr:exopolyphosphatase [bacterium]